MALGNYHKRVMDYIRLLGLASPDNAARPTLETEVGMIVADMEGEMINTSRYSDILLYREEQVRVWAGKLPEDLRLDLLKILCSSPPKKSS